MESAFWASVHGASTHFPIALVLCSSGADTLGFVFANRPAVRELHAVGYWTMLLAALGSLPAIVSGLFMTKGSLLGHGALRSHHLFAWPAFILMIGLASWRLFVGRETSRSAFAIYLGGVAIAALLTLGAGYWGGELMLHA